MNAKRTLVLVGVLCALGLLVRWLAVEDAFGPVAVGDGVPPVAEEPDGEREALGIAGEGATEGTEPGSAGDERSEAAAGDATKAQAPSTSSVRPARVLGRVVDAAGEPVKHARVLVRHAPEPGAEYAPELAFAAHLPLDVAAPEALFNAPPIEVACGAGGTFAVEAVLPGRLQLLVTAPDHVRHARDDLLAVPGTTLALGDVVLASGPRTPMTIFDDRGRRIAKTALVLASGFACEGLPPLRPDAGVCIALGDDDGELSAPPLGPGQHELVLCAPRHAPRRVEPVATPDKRPFLVQLPEAGTIVARLAIAELGRPARLVRALPADATGGPVPFALRADAIVAQAAIDELRVELRGLEAGRRYELRSASQRQEWDELSPWNPPRTALARTRRDIPTAVLLEYRPDARIKALLTSPLAAAPMTGLELALLGASPSRPLGLADVDAKSRGHAVAFALDGIRPLVGASESVLAIRGVHVARREVLLALVPGEELDLETIELAPAPRARLVLVDRATRKPVRGATVTSAPLPGLLAWPVEDLPGVGVSDDRGRVELATWGLPNTLFSIDARGYAPHALGGLAPDVDRVPEVEVELVRGTPVFVKVVDQDGAPLPGVRVERRDGPWSPDMERLFVAWERVQAPRGDRWDREPAADGLDAAWTGADGVASFPRVRPGQHGFFVRRGGKLLEGEWTSREIPAGGELEFALASLRRITCNGRFTSSDGPLAHAEVALWQPRDDDAEDLRRPEAVLPPALAARTDAEGRFRFENLQPGPYRIAARLPWQRWRFVHELVLRTDARPFTIDLDAHAVHGLVVSASGTPVAGATIEHADVGGREGPAAFLLEPLRRVLDLPDDVGLGFEALATTDEHGRFRLSGLGADEALELRARLGDHEASATVSRIADGAAPVLRLEPRGALRLVVGASARSTGESAFVLAADGAGALFGMRVAAGVPVVLPGLPPGDWTVLALPVPDARASQAGSLVGVDARMQKALEEALRAMVAGGGTSQVRVVAGETQPVGLELP